MARLSSFLLPGLLAIAVLNGCGNKGALYLPTAPVEQVSTSEQILDETNTPANHREGENTTAAPTAARGNPNGVITDDGNNVKTPTKEVPRDEGQRPNDTVIDASGVSPDAIP